MIRSFAAAVTTCLVLLAGPAQSQQLLSPQQQPQPPVGTWRCVVNSPVVSIDVQMQVSPDRSLMAGGTLHYVGTSSFYQLQGGGDWTLFPPGTETNGWLYKFRMFPQNHSIVDWYVAPTTTPGIMYNLFYPPSGGVVETSCQRIG